MSIKVIAAGLSTSIQDLGRPGYYHLGIPIGGAMDRFAIRCGNLLVGNPEDAAGLEAVFMGPELEFTEDTTIAVTGGELPPKIDGDTKETWTAIDVKAGQVLSFDYIRNGARAYIAIAGGIDTPAALGSRSTYGIGALGGVEGRPIQAGDDLPVGNDHAIVRAGTTVPEHLRRKPGNPAELRVVPGLYWHRITEMSGSKFFEDTWKVAPEADRMGYRFQGGAPLDFVDREPPFGAGRPIQAGDDLPVGNDHAIVRAGTTVPEHLRRKPGNPAELRVVPGLYWHRITEMSGSKFFEDTWKVAPEADRMGYRFQGGAPLDFVDREPPFGAGSDPSNITDACYPYGSVQVPSGTEPIILHRDAVSGGGYFMIGTVISADMDLIGQLQPHTETRFIKVNMDTALAARCDRVGMLTDVRAALS